MRDYWLGRLFFDLQNPAAATEYRADRAAVLARYPLKDEVMRAVVADDVTFLARLVNPYLLRFYFQSAGMSDEVFIKQLREGGAVPRKSANG